MYYTHCRACHRPLTDPESKYRGIGPVCRQKAGRRHERNLSIDFQAPASREQTPPATRRTAIRARNRNMHQLAMLFDFEYTPRQE